MSIDYQLMTLVHIETNNFRDNMA